MTAAVYRHACERGFGHGCLQLKALEKKNEWLKKRLQQLTGPRGTATSRVFRQKSI
jgi:hypothetical protein